MEPWGHVYPMPIGRRVDGYRTRIVDVNGVLHVYYDEP